MTVNVISGTRASVGRRKVNFEQTPLRLPEGTLARIDAVLVGGETRADLLRVAVEKEVAKRESTRKTKRDVRSSISTKEDER